MKLWKDLTHYAGFDWAKDHHCVVNVDSGGSLVADFEFEHSAEGWKSFAEKTSAWPSLAVSIETSQGTAVDQLLQRQYTIYPVHPVPGAQSTQRHQNRLLGCLGAGRCVAHRRSELESS